MRFKLGFDDIDKKQQLQTQLFQVKLDLLDYEYTFGESSYNLDYLIKLHEYLFSDIFEIENNNLRDSITQEEKRKVNNILNKLVELAVNYDGDNVDIFDYFYILWDMQIFKNGNSRTVLAFLKVYIMAFNISIDYDFKLNEKKINKVKNQELS